MNQEFEPNDEPIMWTLRYLMEPKNPMYPKRIIRCLMGEMWNSSFPSFFDPENSAFRSVFIQCCFMGTGED